MLAENGATGRLFTALQEERIIGVGIRVPAMDSTSVKVRRHAAGVPKKGGSRSVGVSRGGRNMVERVFDRMKHYRKAATRHDRLDASKVLQSVLRAWR